MFNFKQGYYADVRIEDRYSTNIVNKQGKLDNYYCRQESMAFIRVFDGSRWYYTSTAQMDSIQQELDNLYMQATPNKDIDNHPIVKLYEINKENKLRYQDCSVRNIPKDQKTAVADKYCRVANSEYAKLIVALYLDNNNVFRFYSSKGADICYDTQSVGLVVQFALAHEDENFTDEYMYCGQTFDDLIGHEQGVADVLTEAEKYLLNAKPCKKGNFPVVLAPVVAGVFAHESFGHKSEADFMLGDETMAKEWTIGKSVASDILTITDCGVDVGKGYVPFDDEGTRSRMNYLIHNGKLAGRLHSA